MISFEGATPLAAFTGIERNGSCILDIVPESWAGRRPIPKRSSGHITLARLGGRNRAAPAFRSQTVSLKCRYGRAQIRETEQRRGSAPDAHRSACSCSCNHLVPAMASTRGVGLSGGLFGRSVGARAVTAKSATVMFSTARPRRGSAVPHRRSSEIARARVRFVQQRGPDHRAGSGAGARGLPTGSRGRRVVHGRLRAEHEHGVGQHAGRQPDRGIEPLGSESSSWGWEPSVGRGLRPIEHLFRDGGWVGQGSCCNPIPVSR